MRNDCTTRTIVTLDRVAAKQRSGIALRYAISLGIIFIIIIRESRAGGFIMRISFIKKERKNTNEHHTIP